ncbi:MAG: GDP-mannose 4,6-dehydratase [Planctomycetota bacterium]
MTTFWRDRRVFVTGATGLLGSWVVKDLVDRGAHVVALVRDHVPGSNLVRLGLDRRVDTVRGALEDRELLERALGEYEVATVIHLAAQTIVGIANRNPVSTFESNVRGTWNLLEACRRSPLVREIVVASSDKAYGDQEVLPYAEEAPLEGRHPYDVSKSCADLIARSYFETYASPVCITRCGNFYGGGDLNWNRIVPGTIRSVLRGERPVIRSDGKFVRDYFYVKDGARAVLHLVERMAQDRALLGEAFNFSNELQVTVLDLVARILALMDSKLVPDVKNEATHEIVHQYLSAKKARERLGWTPAWDLERGLRETVDWYREYLKT